MLTRLRGAMSPVILLDFLIRDEDRGLEPRVDKAQHGELPLKLRPQIRFRQAISGERVLKSRSCLEFLFLQSVELLACFLRRGCGIVAEANLAPDEDLIYQTFGGFLPRFSAEIER